MKCPDDVRAWPHNWYGIWADGDEPASELPTLESTIDPSWNPPDKERLVSYLTQSPIVVAGGAIIACRLCPRNVPMTTFQSDGVWLWPMDLSHYVLYHSVTLPDRLVQHVRNRNYAPPKEELGLPVSSFPWPESFSVFREWDRD